MDPSKLETMSKWPIPTKKKEVQAFFAFANYYRRCIVIYRVKARPLIDLTKMFPSLRDIHKSKPTTNSEHDSSQLPLSPNLIERLRQSWKLMPSIKQLLVSGLNTTSSKDASSFNWWSTIQKPSPLYYTTG